MSRALDAISSLRDQPITKLALMVGASAAAIWLVKRLSHRLKYKYPPGPWGLPLLGNVDIMTKSGSDTSHKLSNELFEKYGPMVTLSVGPNTFILVLDRELVHEGLLSKELTDRVTNLFSIDYVSENRKDIFASPNNERWRYHRKAAHSAFRMFAQTDQLEQLVVDTFDNVRKYFTETSEPQDLYEKVYLLLYNLQCRMAFSKEYTPTDPEFLMLRNSIETVNQAFLAGLPADALPILKYLPHERTKAFVKGVDSLISWAKDLCEQKKRSYNPSEMNDILDFLIKEQKAAVDSGRGHLFEDVHLRQTVIDIFTAGTDTTTFTLYWLIMALTDHPDMQERCYSEISSVFGSEGTPTLTERERLPYTDAFLHEVMRYWPLVGMVPRVASEDCHLGGYAIPNGTQFLLSTHRCHFDPKAFPDPLRFSPEHFLDEAGAMAPYRRSFLPFGAGSRVCLGESIAKRTTFLLTVLLIQSFQFVKNEGDSTETVDEKSNIVAILPRRFEVRVVPRRG